MNLHDFLQNLDHVLHLFFNQKLFVFLPKTIHIFSKFF